MHVRFNLACKLLLLLFEEQHLHIYPYVRVQKCI